MEGYVFEDFLARCELCPRRCGADRSAGRRGVCGAADELRVARAALHFWEEPPISGEAGSGTVFFSNCPLHCVYCQNARIANGRAGADISVARLARIFLELQGKGALNINLVTATHYAPHVHRGASTSAYQGLRLPVVWNTSGYETVETVRLVAPYVQTFLTDFRYTDPETARAYSHAPITRISPVPHSKKWFGAMRTLSCAFSLARAYRRGERRRALSLRDLRRSGRAKHDEPVHACGKPS